MDEKASQDAIRSEGSPPPATSALSFDPRDLIPTPIFCATPDGRLVWMNAAAEQLTGRLAPAISGEPFTCLFPEEGRRSIARRFIRNRRRKVTDFYLEAPLSTKDDTHWVGMHVRLATAGNGKTAYLCSAHDLQSIHSELEGLRRNVRESEARLVEASAGSELKSAYLASMSHELRAPMNGVIGMSRLLLDSGLDRDQRTFAEVIQESGQHLLELVDDILDYSRIEAGQLEIARMDFDVRVTVDAVAALLADSTHRKGVTFSSWVHHRVPSRLTGDPSRVRQVLLDLANHALRAADGGELSLRVELVEESAHQAVVRFWVNRGYASPSAEDDVASFAAFGDVEGATPVATVGARTLGLSISKRIVHLMGGDSGVVAVPGLGARLWFRVPLGKQEDVAPAGIETTPDTGLSGLRVLVADGNEAARHELARRLTAQGCVCDEAEGGLDALQRLKNNAAGGRAYSLAFVDLDLPELTAESLASSVRDDLALSSTALVMTTNVGRPGDAARAGSWGYDAYFVAPIDDDQLAAAISESIASRRSASASASSERALVTRFTIAEKRRSRVRVLVVESNPIDQLVVLSALRRVGYAPEAVTNGDDALAACEKQPFDVVFLDLGSSVEAGIELIGTLRGIEAPRRTPVIALTARMRDGEKERCTGSGFDDFLPKPIDLELLCATVDRWTRPAPSAAETPAVVEENAPAEAFEPAPTEPVAESPAEPAPDLEIERAPTWSAPASVETAPEVIPVVDAEPDATGEPGPETKPEETPAPVPDITEAWVADGSWEAVPVLDASRIETSSMGNPELRSMLMDAFVTRTQQPLARLRLAHGAGDTTQVEIQSHALAGLCSAIGATRAAALFERIASGATPERMSLIESLIARSEREVKLAMESVEPRAEAA